MTKLLVQNSKMSKSTNSTHVVYNFGIPAYRSSTGLTTCPMAGVCATGCYATMGSYTWSTVAKAYEYRLQRTLAPQFQSEVQAELDGAVRRAGRAGKQVVIRIHDSGDFYSIGYIEKWFDIIRANPNVVFYAYTKQVPLFQSLRGQGRVPANLTLIFSEGGLADKRIDTATDRHSRVFTSHDELIAAGYADASSDDLVAALGSNHRIGLVYHGYKSRSWNTGTNTNQ